MTALGAYGYLVTRDAGIQIVHVQGCPAPAGGFAHYLPHEIQRFTQTRGERVLECEWRGLSVSGLWEIGGKESVDDNGVDFSLCGMRQAVAAFDLGKEALSHKEALLFNRGRKHHIYPQLASPARLAHDRQVIGAGDARRLESRRYGGTCTNARDRHTA